MVIQFIKKATEMLKIKFYKSLNFPKNILKLIFDPEMYK